MTRLLQCVGILLFVTGQIASAQSDIRWAPDLASAQRAAQQYQVPLLIHYTSDNCLPCRTLEDRVYSQPTVSTALNKYFICVRINGGQDPQACQQFAVHSFPTDVFLAADGSVLYQGVSKQDISGYMDVLQRVAVMNRDRNTLLAANRAAQTPPSNYANSSGGAILPAAATDKVDAAGPNRFAGLLDGASSATITANNPAPTITTTAGPLTANHQTPAISRPTTASETQVAAANGTGLKDSQAGLPPLPAHLVKAPMGNNALVNNNAHVLAHEAGLPINTTEPAASVAPAVNSGQVQSATSVKPNLGSGILVSNPYFPSEQSTVQNSVGNGTRDSQLAAQQQTATKFAQSTTAAPVTATAAVTGQFDARTRPSTPNVGTSGMLVSNTTVKPNAQPVSTQSSLTTATPTGSTTAATAVASEPPALNGCCPVNFIANRQCIPGSATFVIRHRGRNYWLQNAQSAQQFLQKPDYYSPRLSGYDPMMLLNEGKFVDGVTEYAMQDPTTGAVFLFATAASRDQFAANQEKALKALDTLLRSSALTN